MKETVKTWTVLDILKVTEAAFRERGIMNPRLNAELLLADTTGDSRINLYLNFEKPLTENEVSGYRDKVKRRLKFEPLQYIRGKTEFYSLEFRVTPDVLIPRQETEILVEKVLEYIKVSGIECPKILEIGTGSGCISIAIAANAECSISAFDISNEAVKVAELNAAANGTGEKVKFDVKDFFDPEVTFEGFDIIVSNPPYIPYCEQSKMSISTVLHEPDIALFVQDETPLLFYERIAIVATQHLKANGMLYFELNEFNAVEVQYLLEKIGFSNVEIRKDLSDKNRMMRAQFISK